MFSVLVALGLSASAQQTDVAVKTGAFSADYKSLSGWECPEWFKDAKFGIWAHWGPQCHAEDGDWYARGMYQEGSGQNQWHYDHFGDPAEFGLKELCNDWKAQNWDPERLVNLYKSVGARYFMALGNHHDNFDLWNSPYQEWNSVNMGPKKDIIKGWSDACKKAGLPLGVSIHASHAWTWLEPSRDYDGLLTKEDGYKPNADGTEKWWKGYDPQELYAQNHERSKLDNVSSMWDWNNGASLPSEEYKQKFQNRVLEMINDYDPQMIYFDDTAMPFYGCDDKIGQNILAHYYNTSAAANGGTPQVVATGKQLDSDQKDYMMWDVERGIPDRMQKEYWQTCTCIGSWHYDQNLYKNGWYKSGATVIRMLVDIVSKNGNLLLSVPVKSDGTIDDKEEAILADIKAWMDVNGESIYGTRTWKTFGEGPLADAANPVNAQGFNEGLNYSSKDVRYVQKDGTIYATILSWPAAGRFSFKSFSLASDYYSGKVKSVKLLGSDSKIEYSQGIEGLTVMIPSAHPNEIAPVFAITVEDVEQSAYEKLQESITSLENYVSQMRTEASYINTGKLSTLYLPNIQEAINAAKQVGKDAAEKDVEKALQLLMDAYNDFLANGTNKGGKFEGDYQSDVTEEYLVEAENFTRQGGGTDRFGDPLNWTVENFNIPQGNSDGVKAGLDKYSGKEALYLGLWDDRQNNTEGDLTNARIYRKVSLPAGSYYFGAGYNTHYNLSANAYMFVSTELCATADVPQQSIAYYPISDATEDRQLCGLWFKLEEDQEVYIGFQADLQNGSGQQEFRAEKVALYQLADDNEYALQNLLYEIDSKLEDFSEQVGLNTGFYNQQQWDAMRETCDEWLEKVDDLTGEEATKAYYQVNERWEDFIKNGKNKGGLMDADNSVDVTVEVLKEKTDFAPSDPAIETRFAAPLNWTVENFQIPNGGDGTKAGLDKYGRSTYALMLGIWDDRQNNEAGDLKDARIYQKVTLTPGKYFFGTTFNALYQLNAAYIFVSKELIPTSEMETSSLAYININECKSGDGNTYGLYFTLDEEQEVYIGFQADLANGSGTQEFRSETLSLLRYNTLDKEVLRQLIDDVDAALKEVKVSDNTGFYTQESYDEVKSTLDDVNTKGAVATSSSEVEALYDELRKAYADFLANGRNKGGILSDDEEVTDMTSEQLVEVNNFSRADEGVTDRFATPKYWTVENYQIPSSSEGVRGGLDSYPGRDNLTLGIWDDKQNAPETSDISNACVYRKVSLEAGRYFFGGIYNTIYNLDKAYIFAADEVLSTDDMEKKSIAYMSVGECSSDGNYWGIYFTLDEPQEVLLGWQADLLNGANAQEFRVEKVKLVKMGGSDVPDAIADSPADLDATAPVEIYTLQGIRLDAVPQHGFYIVKQGGKVMKKYHF